MGAKKELTVQLAGECRPLQVRGFQRAELLTCCAARCTTSSQLPPLQPWEYCCCAFGTGLATLGTQGRCRH